MTKLNTAINDDLLMQARQLTGIYSDKVLLEYALQIVIALQPITQTSPIKSSAIQRIGKAAERLSPSAFKTIDSSQAYQGKPLSLEDMQTAIQNMAAQHK